MSCNAIMVVIASLLRFRIATFQPAFNSMKKPSVLFISSFPPRWRVTRNA